MDEFTRGLILGLLIGEGHFGGDGRQAHVTLRMHARHEKLFAWLLSVVPGSRLYGPYTHGGRTYYQWMVRGAALRDFLAKLNADVLALIDPPSHERLQKMKRDYQIE